MRFSCIPGLAQISFVNGVLEVAEQALRLDIGVPLVELVVMSIWMCLFFNQHSVIELNNFEPFYYVFHMSRTAYMLSRNPLSCVCMTICTFATVVGSSFWKNIPVVSWFVFNDIFCIVHWAIFVLTVVHEFIAVPKFNFVELFFWMLWQLMNTIYQGILGACYTVWGLFSCNWSFISNSLTTFGWPLIITAIVGIVGCGLYYLNIFQNLCWVIFTSALVCVASTFFLWLALYTLCACNDHINDNTRQRADDNTTVSLKKFKVRDYVRFVVFTVMILSMWHKSPPTTCEITIRNNVEQKQYGNKTSCDGQDKRTAISKVAGGLEKDTMAPLKKTTASTLTTLKNGFIHQDERYFVQGVFMFFCGLAMVWLLSRDS